ncbi:AraC family transcriptional regulator [Rhizobium lemnae]|uniref:GyrI-like domain-containing protein n=1 Tax=Rhizobium lemnae TaxID=1214924 RepID=A0ABV8E462_9HYPH|nr:AraC family transcriptional regulator [Rhizobium lemnae]MCJ8509832.1 AraC family transcriptional regulator [Rhizobium lemnae]
MDSELQRYHVRMQRVLEHIDRNLDGNLDLEALSHVAAFSKFHFHRQFTGIFGLSVHRYVQLARMKRASYRLAFRESASVTDVAMDAGYDSPDAFARAFRQRFDQSPSEFRKSPNWEPWCGALHPLDKARSKLLQKYFTPDDITIRNVLPTTVAIMEHRGDPATIGATIQHFIAWRKAAGLPPQVSPTFNIFYSDPHAIPPAEYRLDLCAGTDQPIVENSDGVRGGLIPGGRCAVLRVLGNTENLEPAALYLYKHWLPASGEELRDFPIYCQRLSFFPDVPEQEAVAELFLPLK